MLALAPVDVDIVDVLRIVLSVMTSVRVVVQVNFVGVVGSCCWCLDIGGTVVVAGAGALGSSM